MVRAAARQLATAGVEAPEREAWLLLAHVMGTSRARLLAGWPAQVEPAFVGRFMQLVERRRAREPMAYVLGEREFWSLRLAVSPAVLVPRPDSETLVAALLQRQQPRDAALRILDLGTGSGCLLLALLGELPAATGVGVDLSAAALAVAADNARSLGLATRCRFIRGSWGRALQGRFDLIVSNPPYIPSAQLDQLQPEVAKFEPRLALAAGQDGLDAYRALLPDVARLLAPEGWAALELGEGQAGAVSDLARAAGLVVSAIEPDLAGIDRCLLIRHGPQLIEE